MAKGTKQKVLEHLKWAGRLKKQQSFPNVCNCNNHPHLNPCNLSTFVYEKRGEV